MQHCMHSFNALVLCLSCACMRSLKLKLVLDHDPSLQDRIAVSYIAMCL